MYQPNISPNLKINPAKQGKIWSGGVGLPPKSVCNMLCSLYPLNLSAICYVLFIYGTFSGLVFTTCVTLCICPTLCTGLRNKDVNMLFRQSVQVGNLDIDLGYYCSFDVPCKKLVPC